MKRIRDKEEELRELAEEESEALEELMVAGMDAEVSPLVLSSIMDLGSEARELIVRAALPNLHRLLQVDRALNQIVYDVLGRLFQTAVQNAVQRLQAWGGRTWGDVETLLGDLLPLLFDNANLPAAWFLSSYGDTLLYPNETARGRTAHRMRIAVLGWVQRSNLWSAFMNLFGSIFKRDTSSGHEEAADAMTDMVEFWMSTTPREGSQAWHALLWTLVARYQLVDVGDAFLAQQDRVEDSRFLMDLACRILFTLRLTPADAKGWNYDAWMALDPDVVKWTYNGYWFLMPPTLLSVDDVELPLLTQAYRHQHPREAAPTMTLYREPNLFLFLRGYGELHDTLDPEEQDPFTRLALMDVGNQHAAPPTDAEAFLPFDTYTPWEWGAILADFVPVNEARRQAWPLWPALRDDIARRLVDTAHTLDGSETADDVRSLAQQLDRALGGLRLTLAEIHEILLHIPSPRPPDVMILLMRWFPGAALDMMDWYFEPSAVDHDFLLDIRQPLVLNLGDPVRPRTFIRFMLRLLRSFHWFRLSAFFASDSDILYAIQWWVRQLLLAFAGRLPRSEQAAFFRHAFPATVLLEIFNGNYAWSPTEPNEARLWYHLIRGSEDTPRHVFNLLLAGQTAQWRRAWEEVLFPSRDPDVSVSEAVDEDDEEQDMNVDFSYAQRLLSMPVAAGKQPTLLLPLNQ